MRIIIPSCNSNNLQACVAAIRRREGSRSIIVVDDGLEIMPNDIDVVIGKKPFVFARNINIGINRALDLGCTGVVLLNDDAILETDGGFSKLVEVSMEHPECGLIAPSCTNTGNLNQRPAAKGFRYEPRMVCFTCVYIPKSTFKTVGLLDDRFVYYGFDDDDYCLRVRIAGLKIGITDDVIVDHGRLISSYRGDPRTPANLSRNAAIFRAKWGADNHAL